MNPREMITAEVLSADYGLDRYLVRVVYDDDPYLVLIDSQTRCRVMDERLMPDAVGDVVSLPDGIGNVRITALDAVAQVIYRTSGPG